MIQKKITDELKELQNCLCPQTTSHEYPAIHQSLRYELLKCKGNFYGSVERKILLFKIKILQHLQDIYSKHQDEEITNKQVCLHQILRKKIETINGDIDMLLEEGLLTLYIQLNELKQQCLSHRLSEITLQLLVTIIFEIASLLRKYFVFQQYQCNKLKNNKQRQSIFSLKNIPELKNKESENSQIDEDLIKQIEEYIDTEPLSELFQKQMRKEEKKMKNSLEICRICFQQIKLSQLEKHVNTCAKKSHLQLELDLKKHQINQKQEQLKEMFQQSCEESIHQDIDQAFRKICALILQSRKIERKHNRRCSLIGVKSQKNIGERIQLYIQDFLEDFGSNTTLEQLLALYRERDLIEKKMTNLEMTSLFSDHNAHPSQFHRDTPINVRRSKNKNHTMFSFSPPTKSNFSHQFPYSQNQDSNLQIKPDQTKFSQQQQSESQKSPQKQESKQSDVKVLMRKISTKRSFSRKHDKEKEQELECDLNVVKHYSSLHDILSKKPEQNQVKRNKITLKDFQILQFLGQGAFGKVYMARRKQTKDVYALKIIKITEDYTEKELLLIKNEHEIFKKIAGDHLVKAPFSFNENSSHIFVMEFLPGGDLRKLLNDQIYFEEDRAKFFLAEIILAIEHLHKYGIIHRDLKPQNLVLDRKGHLKLTDFGLSEFQVSKKLNQSRQQAQELREVKSSKNRRRRAAVCGVNKQKMKLIGTPDYIAPEIINQTSYSNYTIDWWSLGVMAYELIIGTRPFCADTLEQVIDNITNFNIQWPEVGQDEGMITSEAKDFISKLLNKDFTQRLGVNGADQLKMHPFMEGIDWINLKTSAAAFMPKRMTKLSDLVNMQQDPDLKKQVEDFLNQGGKKVNNLNIENFIRFDLLKTETIENMQKKQEQTKRKLKRLKTLKDISNEMIENINQ